MIFFNDLSFFDALALVGKGQVPPLPESCPRIYSDLHAACLQLNPHDRLVSEELWKRAKFLHNDPFIAPRAPDMMRNIASRSAKKHSTDGEWLVSGDEIALLLAGDDGRGGNGQRGVKNVGLVAEKANEDGQVCAEEEEYTI